MLDLTTVGEDFDRTNAVRKAGAFAPAFLRIELTVRKYGTLTGDHLVVPWASSSQIG